MRQSRLHSLAVGRSYRRATHITAGLKRISLIAGAFLLAYLLWPYAALWRLDAAVQSADPQDLADLVDLVSVRGEIKKKLNKDANSSIDRLSDRFIGWLQEGIKAAGNEAVDRLVTLDWVRARLLAHSQRNSNAGFLGQVSRAFFDAPDGFRVCIGPEHADPVRMRMQLRDFSWRVSAVYY